VLDPFHPVTIQLLAAKVSAVSGNVRRALGIVWLKWSKKRWEKSGKLVDLKKLEVFIEEDGDAKQETTKEVKDEKKHQEPSKSRKSWVSWTLFTKPRQRHGGIFPDPAENPDHHYPPHHQKQQKQGNYNRTFPWYL
jgi:hypothetical protein